MRFVKKHDAGTRTVVGNADVFKRGNAPERRFDFSELDTVAKMFYLKIAPAFENNFAAFVEMNNVSRAINFFRKIFVFGILHEGGIGSRGIVPVAERERCAAHAKLSRNAGRADAAVLFVQNHYVGIAARLADGQRLVIAEIAIKRVKRAIDANFRRSVKIGKNGVRVVAPPNVQLLRRHDFAREKNAF